MVQIEEPMYGLLAELKKIPAYRICTGDNDGTSSLSVSLNPCSIHLTNPQGFKCLLTCDVSTDHLRSTVSAVITYGTQGLTMVITSASAICAGKAPHER